MDDRRFDNVVRSLARHRSRRSLVGSLLGGVVALLAAHLRLPRGGGPPECTSPRVSGASTPISAIWGSTAPGAGVAPPVRPVARG